MCWGREADKLPEATSTCIKQGTCIPLRHRQNVFIYVYTERDISLDKYVYINVNTNT